VGVTPAGMDGRVGDVSLIQVGVAMPPSRLVEKGKEAAASGGCAFGVQAFTSDPDLVPHGSSAPRVVRSDVSTDLTSPTSPPR
jgi:hypothetical protein